MVPQSKPLLIARTELRRSLRAFRTNRYQLLATAVMALVFLLPMVVFGAIGARGAGEALAAGESFSGFDVVGVARGGVAAFWVLVAFLVASRAVGKTATVDEREAVLPPSRSRPCFGGCCSPRPP